MDVGIVLPQMGARGRWSELTLRRDVIHLIDAVERNEEDQDRKEGPSSEPHPK